MIYIAVCVWSAGVSMKRGKVLTVQAVMTFVALVFFLAMGHFGAIRLVQYQQLHQLNAFNEVALRRSESLVDHGIDALDKIARNGPLDCSPAAMQAVRLSVYRHGAVKDVRGVTSDGLVRCSAYPETLEFDKGWVTRADMLETNRKEYHLFRVEHFFSNALGVMRDTGNHEGIVAIIGVGTSLFDILPAELAQDSVIRLETANGDLVAGPEGALPDEGIVLSASSNRYPISTTMAVSRVALSAWNAESYIPVMVLAALLGLVSGILVSRTYLRPTDPLCDMDRAIARGEFLPHYQPIFELVNKRIIGAEVLLRWKKTDGSIWTPARFIELAENSGRINEITWNVLRTSLREMHAALVSDSEFKLSINVVPRQFMESGFIDNLYRMVKDSGINTDRITVEITEREPFDDIEDAVIAVARCRKLGFRIAIDDVGTGHSGLSQIQSLSVDILKVDKFFVDAINDDSTAPIVIEMLVRLARERGMNIVAEGIETDEQARALVKCGVAFGQGYLISPAIPSLKFLALYGQELAETGSAEKTRGPINTAA